MEVFYPWCPLGLMFLSWCDNYWFNCEKKRFYTTPLLKRQHGWITWKLTYWHYLPSHWCTNIILALLQIASLCLFQWKSCPLFFLCHLLIMIFVVFVQLFPFFFLHWLFVHSWLKKRSYNSLIRHLQLFIVLIKSTLKSLKCS